MKLAASLAFFATATSGVLAQHVDCSEAVIATITETHAYEHCNRDTGFEFSANGTTTLTTEVLEQLCAVHDCVELASSVEAMGIEECEVNGVHLLMDIVEPIEAACGSTESSGSSATHSSDHGSTTSGSVEVEASDDDSAEEVEASDDDAEEEEEEEHGSMASSNSTADTPAPSTTTSAAPTSTLAASALLMTAVAGLAL